jgi:hypothetical protein
MEFIEKLDNPVPMKNYDGNTYYIYPVNVEATPQEKNNLMQLLELISEKQLASTGGYNNFHDVLIKVRKQKDEGNRLTLFDKEFHTIKVILSELWHTPTTEYGFPQEIYNSIDKDIAGIHNKIFKKGLSDTRIDDANTRHP